MIAKAHTHTHTYTHTKMSKLTAKNTQFIKKNRKLQIKYPVRTIRNHSFDK